MSTKSLSRIPLALRLLEVCEAIPAMQFTEHNDEHNFDWVKASQLYEAFRNELRKRKILLLTDEQEITHSDFVDKNGELWRETTIKIQYEIRDCFSEERIVKTHFGSGVAEANTGFGLYIAKTMGNKYFLRGIAMIPWAEGDQEFQNRKNKGMSGIEAEKPEYKKMSKAEREDDSKIRAWHSAIRQGSKTEKQVIFYLIEEHNCESIRDLFSDSRKEDLSKAMAWAVRTMPNEDDVRLAEKAKARKKVTPMPKTAQPAITIAEAEREDEMDFEAGD